MVPPPEQAPRYLVPASLELICGRAGGIEEMLCPASALRWLHAPPPALECASPCRLEDPAQERFFFAKPAGQFDRVYRFPPRTLCAIPGATLAGRAHAVIAPPRYVVTESVRSRAVLETDGMLRQADTTVDSAHGSRDVSLVTMAPRRVTRTVPEPALLLSQYWHFNYHHWMLECLPRLRWCMEEAQLARLAIVGPPRPDRLRRDTLRSLGVGERVLEFDNGCWQFDNLLFPSPGAMAPDDLAWLRVQLTGSRTWRLGNGAGERLYVSRANAATRRVRNEREVTATLKRHGFAVVHPEEEPLQGQVERFSRAAVVAGAHGSGLTNALFAPGDALVLELSPDDRVNHCYWVLANALGQRYAFLSGRTVNDARDFEVDVDALERLVRACL